MQSFSCCQTFFLDPGAVANAPACGISALDLYFQAKPARNSNVSGIASPGVSIFVCPTIFGVPKLENVQYTFARCEYDQIATSSDATIPTRFRFPVPVPVATGKEYAIVVMFDGSEPFVLWSSTAGQYLIDTKTISPGASGKYIGSYYDYTNTPANFDANGNLLATLTKDQYQAMWTPRNSFDLKFTVYAARYSFNGFAVASNTAIPSNVQVIHTPAIEDPNSNNNVFLYPASSLEMMLFDQASSVKESFVGGQWAYQNTFSYPGGYANGSSYITVAVSASDRVTANSYYPNGAPFSWRDVYPTLGNTNSQDSPYIVLRNGNQVDVRSVTAVVSNTIIQLDEPVTFVNSQAQFLKTPVGLVDSFNKSSPFGNFESIVVLANSSANSSLRFVSNAVKNISVGNNGGVLYSNTDVLYVIGYENVPGKVAGGYPAVANVVTNGNGSITALYFSNIGSGFNNTGAAQVVVANATTNAIPLSNTTGGVGAVLTPTFGSEVRTELRPNIFNNVQVVNFALSDVIPYFDIDQPPGTSIDIKMRCSYYVVEDLNLVGNLAYYVAGDQTDLTIPASMFVKNSFRGATVPAFVSRSNEYVIKYANGAPNDRVSPGHLSNSMVMVINTSSNNDFTCCSVNSIPTMSLSTYIVNDTYEGENTDQGKAWARQITTQTNFNRTAEDLVVRLTAYKPATTDIKVYARIWHSADSEYFQDKDWTLLASMDTANLVSSSSDPSDEVELSFTFPAYPNVDLRLNGTGTTNLSSATVTGLGTNFTTDLQVGDLLKISNPVFPDQYVIDVVKTVTNSTSLVLNNPVANTDFATYGLALERIRTYKHQAFHNLQNSNTARYYTSSMVPFDGYFQVQVKAIMMAERPNFVPRIDDLRFIGVSA